MISHRLLPTVIMLAIGSILVGCGSREVKAVGETWEFNAAGDMPAEAVDDVELQDGLTDTTWKSYTYVDDLTAVLPNGIALTGIDTIAISMDGTMDDRRVSEVRLGWPTQSRQAAFETLREIAGLVDLDPAAMERWTGQDLDKGAQSVEVEGLRIAELSYLKIDEDRIAVDFTLFWALPSSDKL